MKKSYLILCLVLMLTGCFSLPVRIPIPEIKTSPLSNGNRTESQQSNTNRLINNTVN